MMDLISGFMAQAMEIERVKELEKQFQTAKKLGMTKCNKCGYCCYRRTCIPTPEELRKIAKFFKLTPKQLINKYYAIDVKSFDSNYYVKPIGINQKDLVGKFIPADRTFDEGKCIFLDDDNLCKVHSIGIQSAKDCECWNEDKEYKDVIKEWTNDILFKEFGIDKEIINWKDDETKNDC